MKTEIEVDGVKVTPPSSWNDLSDRDCMRYYDLIFSNTLTDESVTAFTMLKLIDMARDMCGVSVDDIGQIEKASKQVYGEEMGEQVFLAQLREMVHTMIEGLFNIEHDDEGNVTYSVKFNRTRNLWTSIEYDQNNRYNRKKPSRTAPKRYLYPPADMLANVTIYELGTLFTIFEQYLMNPERTELIDRLIATMYRPMKEVNAFNMDSNFEGDRRQPLRRHESRIDDRQKLVAQLPMLVKRTILFWFASCRMEITRAYPKVFRKQSASTTNNANYGWGGVLLKVAEMGPMGTLNEVADQPFSNVLTYLSMKDDEVKEAERLHKRQGK